MFELDLSHIVPAIRELAIDRKTITRDEHNPRRHSSRNIEAIAYSLSRFGQRTPIVIDGTRKVLKGNGTIMAADLLVQRGDQRWRWLAAFPVDDDETTAASYKIADNRTAELADWAPQILMQTIDLASSTPVDLGFDEHEIQELISYADSFSPVELGSNDQRLDQNDGTSFHHKQRVRCPECGHEFII